MGATLLFLDDQEPTTCNRALNLDSGDLYDILRHIQITWTTFLKMNHHITLH